jgi:hypothetical protein
MTNRIEMTGREETGRVVLPLLLALGGLPVGAVLLIWLFFFGG